MPMALPAPRREGSEVGMDDEDKKITDEIFARIACLEEKVRAHLAFLVALEKELHDLASGSVQRKLAHLVLVKFPIHDPDPDPHGWSRTLSSIATPKMEIREIKRELLDRKVEDLELSVRSANCMHWGSGDWQHPKPIERVGDLIMFTPQDLLRLKNFGRKSWKEIADLLAGMGLSLGAVHVDWEPSPGSAKPREIYKGEKP